MTTRTTAQAPRTARRPERHSLWLEQALAAESPDLAEPTVLSGSRRADVCILGGGFLGLWTALFLKDRNEAIDVAVVEADLCGSGASGRNGGLALSWWSKLSTLVKLCGEDDGRWLASESAEAIRQIGRVGREHGIDCDFVPAGWLWVATSDAQVGTWSSTVDECERRGIDVFEPVTQEEARRRGGSPHYLSGIYDRTAARVHPGSLVRGLRRLALERGVRVFERSRVVGVDGSRPLTVRTPSGSIQADTVVSALNAWTASALPQLRRLRRAYVPVASDMTATAPAPDLLEAIGWTGGEVISDSRLMVHYHRATADGRIAFGKGGGALGALGRFGSSFDFDERRAATTIRSLRWLYPQFAGIDVTHAWSGPVDRSQTGLPCFGASPDHPRLLYGVGFSGNGIGPCVVGARILAAMAVDADDRWTACALTRGPAKLFPPEPVVSLGGQLVRRAVERKERYEDAGRGPLRVDAYLAGLAPAGYFKIGSKKAARAR